MESYGNNLVVSNNKFTDLYFEENFTDKEGIFQIFPKNDFEISFTNNEFKNITMKTYT